jgi:hypothetical protein
LYIIKVYELNYCLEVKDNLLSKSSTLNYNILESEIKIFLNEARTYFLFTYYLDKQNTNLVLSNSYVQIIDIFNKNNRFDYNEVSSFMELVYLVINTRVPQNRPRLIQIICLHFFNFFYKLSGYFNKNFKPEEFNYADMIEDDIRNIFIKVKPILYSQFLKQPLPVEKKLEIKADVITTIEEKVQELKNNLNEMLLIHSSVTIEEKSVVEEEESEEGSLSESEESSTSTEIKYPEIMDKIDIILKDVTKYNVSTVDEIILKLFESESLENYLDNTIASYSTGCNNLTINLQSILEGKSEIDIQLSTRNEIKQKITN